MGSHVGLFGVLLGLFGVHLGLFGVSLGSLLGLFGLFGMFLGSSLGLLRSATPRSYDWCLLMSFYFRVKQ